MKKRYRVTCSRCGKVFTCSGHDCSRLVSGKWIYPRVCVCPNCVADVEAKNKFYSKLCDRRMINQKIKVVFT